MHTGNEKPSNGYCLPVKTRYYCYYFWKMNKTAGHYWNDFFASNSHNLLVVISEY
jgi:hypothetical protein